MAYIAIDLEWVGAFQRKRKRENYPNRAQMNTAINQKHVEWSQKCWAEIDYKVWQTLISESFRHALNSDYGDHKNYQQLPNLKIKFPVFLSISHNLIIIY
jgi:hypothetical protein